MVNWCAITSALILLFSCQEQNDWVHLQGEAQGTSYSIKVELQNQEISQQEIDSLLHSFDKSLSGYLPTSVLSRINAGELDKIPTEDPYFLRCYALSQSIYTKTEGAFDPSVWPLVKLWGFLKNVENVPDSRAVDSVMQFVGFSPGLHHSFDTKTKEFKKLNTSFELDFNAIAQGLSIDMLAEYFDAKHIKNYFIELGGEIRVSGNNPQKEGWRIGIDLPKDDLKNAHQIGQILQLKNTSVATSGNYRKFYIKNGVKYAHTLDAKSGYPAENSLLSVTVVHPICAVADAYATAFMAMGTQKSISFVEDHPELGLEILLISRGQKGESELYLSSGLKKNLLQ